MAFINCPYCKEPISEKDTSCIYCGSPISPPEIPISPPEIPKESKSAPSPQITNIGIQERKNMQVANYKPTQPSKPKRQHILWIVPVFLLVVIAIIVFIKEQALQKEMTDLRIIEQFERMYENKDYESIPLQLERHPNLKDHKRVLELLEKTNKALVPIRLAKEQERTRRAEEAMRQAEEREEKKEAAIREAEEKEKKYGLTESVRKEVYKEIDSTGSESQSRETSSVIVDFSGSGGKNTRPFTANGPWEIQWDVKGDIFQLYLYSSNGDMVGVPANQQGSGKGASYQAKGGKYFLKVNAIGDWAIKIVGIGGQPSDTTGSESQSRETSSVIVDFSGSGGKNTRPFTATGPWEIQWDAKGDIFQLYLYSSNGDMVGVPANQQGSGKGTSYQPKAGKYYLKVNAIGRWVIKVVPVK